MKPDVTINGISMLSLGWLRETVNFPTPQSQSNTITVPGRNSPIRFSEALGRVAYQPRTFEMNFSMLGNRTEYDQLVSAVVNQFSGQLCQVIVSDTPELYAVGTLEAEPSYDPRMGKGTLVISCNDGDAYLYHVSEAEIMLTGDGTATLENDYMPVVPTVTLTEEATLRWSVDGESFHKTVSAGTWVIPELELRHGDNTVSITSEGTTTFRYREGRL